MAGAIVGARFVYVTTYWREEFAGQPFSEIFMIQHGGLVYYGGLIGATVAGVIYIRWKKMPLWKTADVLAPSIALGSVFGRIGCLLNGCCYGRPTDLPWAITFTNPAGARTFRHAARRAAASDGNLRRAAESGALRFSRVAVPAQKIRRPDFCDLSDLLRRLRARSSNISAAIIPICIITSASRRRNGLACRFSSPASRSRRFCPARVPKPRM